MFKIKVKLNRKVSTPFFKFFGKNNPDEMNKIMKKASTSIAKYWYSNIYKFFDARASACLPNTGQLGRSLRTEVSNGRMQLFMVPIHNARTKWVKFDMPRLNMFSGNLDISFSVMPSLAIGRDMNTDYGKLMREGFKPSNHGSFSYAEDRKINIKSGGYHPGYNANTRWVPWMDDFGRAYKGIIASYMIKALRKGGINVNPPAWVPQIWI